MESDKKIVIFYVLNVLQEYSDEKHPLTYKEIVDKIYDKYDVRPDVKAIAYNISTLISAGYEIVKMGYKGCYLSNRGFENGELMYLVDAINSSKIIPSKQAKELIEKLTATCSKYERKKFRSVQKIDIVAKSKNRELFYVIELLSEAIEKNKKVKFNYNEYKITKELTPRFAGKEFTINPYYLVNSNGKYYLVCNYDKYDDLSNYKVECISNITILDESRKPISDLKDTENFSITKYTNEHIYMTYGKSINATLQLEDAKYIREIIDWFGDDVSISTNKDDSIEVKLKVNEQALIYWALQYGEHINVTSPKTTREKIKNVLTEIIKKYE